MSHKPGTITGDQPKVCCSKVNYLGGQVVAILVLKLVKQLLICLGKTSNVHRKLSPKLIVPSSRHDGGDEEGGFIDQLL